MQPVLAIGIHAFKASAVEEGKLLLSDCEELKELAISFHDVDKVSVLQDPILKYTINAKRSRRQVIQWFGPHYRDVEEIRAALTEHKSNLISANTVLKKKWTVDSETSQLSLLTNYPSYSILLLSPVVPSSILSMVISFAAKRGLHLKSICKRTVPSNQLHAMGFSEIQAKSFGYSVDDVKKTAGHGRVLGSFTLLLFYGNSAVIRLLGLIEKLTYILNNPVTGETLQSWFNDKLIKFKVSHNHAANAIVNCQQEDYFMALHFNEHTADLLSTSCAVPAQYIAEDIFPYIHETRLHLLKPELNLVAFIIYGNELLNNLPIVFKVLFGDFVHADLNTWRQSSAQLQYQPAVGLLGVKYMSKMSRHQASYLVPHEPFSSQWKKSTIEMTGINTVMLILRAIDTRVVNQLTTKMSNYLMSARVDTATSNVITHTDVEYVSRLMFLYFHPSELHADELRNRSEVSPVYLPENHHLFTTLDKPLDLKLMSNIATKKTLPKKSWKEILPHASLPAVYNVYQLNPLALSFPIQMLLYSEKCYTGLSIMYNPHHAASITKALARVIRMGFQIAALKFPSVSHSFFFFFLFSVHIVIYIP